ncbi:hypothetical protein CBL_08568 [Carabus blaptoides fortunei]
MNRYDGALCKASNIPRNDQCTLYHTSIGYGCVVGRNNQCNVRCHVLNRIFVDPIILIPIPDDTTFGTSHTSHFPHCTYVTSGRCAIHRLIRFEVSAAGRPRSTGYRHIGFNYPGQRRPHTITLVLLQQIKIWLKPGAARQNQTRHIALSKTNREPFFISQEDLDVAGWKMIQHKAMWTTIFRAIRTQTRKHYFGTVRSQPKNNRFFHRAEEL